MLTTQNIRHQIKRHYVKNSNEVIPATHKHNPMRLHESPTSQSVIKTLEVQPIIP